jgi:hypothetical protein
VLRLLLKPDLPREDGDSCLMSDIVMDPMINDVEENLRAVQKSEV